MSNSKKSSKIHFPTEIEPFSTKENGKNLMIYNTIKLLISDKKGIEKVSFGGNDVLFVPFSPNNNFKVSNMTTRTENNITNKF